MNKTIIILGALVASAGVLFGAVRPSMGDSDREIASKPDRSSGCRLVLELPKASFGPDESIPISLVAVNESKRGVVIWECGFWCNHLIEVTDEQGRKVPLTKLGKARRNIILSKVGRDKNYAIRLGPGRRHRRTTARADLSRLFRLVPGKYQVEVVYDESGSPKAIRCTSNRVDFEIKAQRAVQARAEEAKDCRLALGLPKASFGLGEPIPIELVFENTSHREVVIRERGFWSNHLIEVKYEHGAKPPISELGEFFKCGFSPGDAGAKDVPIRLGPDERHRCETAGVDLSKIFDLRPGKYRAEVTYDDRRQPGAMWCISNAVDFEVTVRRAKSK